MGANAQTKFDKQGHRGIRGLMPENTIQSMKMTQDLGAVLEMDISFSGDKQLIVSHDQWLTADIVLTPEGKTILKKDQKDYNLYKMSYEEIKKYDIGMKGHPDFPQQRKMPAYIPLLAELIDSVELYAKKMKYKLPRYNMEIKTKASSDNVFHPEPEEFSKRLMELLNKKKIQNRVMIQSFDVRALEIIHRDYKKMEISYLVHGGSLDENLKKISFKPDIYSPNYKGVTKELVEQCHAKGIKIIPWTANTKEQIEALKRMGVDGIISDYPNLL